MKNRFTRILFTASVALNVFTANAQVINTIAGNGVAGYSGDGGAGNLAQLYFPYGVALDATGSIYIADNYNYLVRKINASNVISSIAGSGIGGYSGDGAAANLAELNSPYGLAVDLTGNVYIADYYNNVIRKVSPTGTISTFAGNGNSGYSGDGGPATSAQLSYPTGVATDAAGNVYIAEYNNNVIRKVNLAGVISTFAGNGVPGFSGDGGLAGLARLNSPTGVSVDASGNVYIADRFNERIRVVNTSGIISTFAGTGVSGFSGDGGAANLAHLFSPTGVASDVSGNVYIADKDNQRVRKVDPSGIISTIAGNGTAGFGGDGGAANNAELNYPYGIAVDASGNIYIADSQNNRVRIVSIATDLKSFSPQETDCLIYPNPAGSFLFLEIKTNEENNITVFNTLGEEIYSDNFKAGLKIDVQNYSSGIYFISIRSKNNTIQRKLVISH